jgi:hypothetical protein
MVSLDKSIQRGGLHVGKDEKPATAADGLAFSSIYNSVGAGYFAAVGQPVLRGRSFTIAEATQPGGPAVAVIDEALAKKLWPDSDALGQRIQIASDHAPKAKHEESGGGMGMNSRANTSIKPEEPIEVVGIAATARGSVFETTPRGTIYVPFARGFQSNAFFFVQFASLHEGNISASADAIRRAVRETDATLPVLSLKTFPQHLEANIEMWIVRAGAAMFTVFGALALLLAIIGVYGVKAYSVARRTREIGIRIALGAQPQSVQWMIIREGSFMLGAGVAIGLLLAAGHRKAALGDVA